MKRTMAVFPPACGKEGDRSVGGDMLTKDKDAFEVCSGGIHMFSVRAKERCGPRLA